MKKLSFLFAVLGLWIGSQALAQDEITVAYFLEWPTPNQLAQVEKLYDEAMGVKVNWVAFDTGVEMTAAMLSGDVQIAYSQGLTPFTNAVSEGVPLKTVGIAVSYAENDNCVVADDSGITQDNAAEMLAGQNVAVPLGTVAHYKFLRTMDHMGVDASGLNVIDLAPADGAVALAEGEVAMACGWGGALRRMLEGGQVLMTAAEQEAIGIRVFDVISVTEDFAEESGDLITSFLQVTEDMHRQYNANVGALMMGGRVTPARIGSAKALESMYRGVADAAGMTYEDTIATMATFSFPLKEEQLSSAWFDGTVEAFMKDVADLFVAEGSLSNSLDDYSSTIDTSFLESVE